MPSAPITAIDATGPPELDLLDSPTAGPAAIRGGVLRVVSYLAGTLLGVGSAALLFRHLGVVDTGRYSLAIYLVAIVAGVSDLGLTAIGVREFSIRTGPARDSLARNLLGFRIALSSVGVVAITLFAVIAGDGAAFAFGVALAGIGLILQSAQSTLVISLISNLRLGLVSSFVPAGRPERGAHRRPDPCGRALAFLAVTIPVGVLLLAAMAGCRTDDSVAARRSICLSGRGCTRRAAVFIRRRRGDAVLLLGRAHGLVACGSKTLGYFSVSVRVIQVLLVCQAWQSGQRFRSSRARRATIGSDLPTRWDVSSKYVCSWGCLLPCASRLGRPWRSGS